MRAFNLIRTEPHYRRWAFERGLTACGYEVVNGPCRGMPAAQDVLIIWNRYGRFDTEARRFEQAGAKVIVAENGVLGRDWRGTFWYSIALSNPAAVGGRVPDLGGDRWASWNVDWCGWRNSGKEVIVLAQRGIGPPGLASPPAWHHRAVEDLKRRTNRTIRIREHPGENPAKPLAEDLADAHCVVTWASNAALKALLLGVPVFAACSSWCGYAAAAEYGADIEQPKRADPTPVLQRIACTSYHIEELATGQPFENLLRLPSIASPIITAQRLHAAR